MGRTRLRGALILAVAGLLLFAVVCVQRCEAAEKDLGLGSEKAVEKGVDASSLEYEEENKEEGRNVERKAVTGEEEVVEEEGEEEEEEGEDSDGEDFQESVPEEEGEDEFQDEDEEEDSVREFDEKDVVVLGSGNFSEFIEANRHVMVEFYAPWCGHCQALAPEYAEAATAVKGEAVLAKVDATVEDELAQKYGIEGYPTIIFFVDGLHKPYNGERLRNDIVDWVKKKTGPSVQTITARSDAEMLMDTSKFTMAIAYLNSLKGSEVEEYSYAARQDDDVVFFQTDSADVAEVFNFPKNVKKPALVLLKEHPEKVNWFDGLFKRDEISTFVLENKLPLVTTFNKETAQLIFESPTKRQILLFADPEAYEKLLPDFKEASKSLIGKIVFVHVDLGDTEQAKGIAEFFGIGIDTSSVMGFESVEGGRKFLMEGEITAENIKAFGEAFLADKLKPHLKSEPIPEKNDGDVKIVVGKNLNDVVLDESKDCFLEIYAPWCGHCQALEPTWNKLAKRLRSVESIVIAKMDGTTNEHARAKPDGYPTLLFFPAGKKSFDPVTFDGDRTLKDFVKFLKKEAAIPFTVPKKPTTTAQPTSPSTSGTQSPATEPESTIELKEHETTTKLEDSQSHSPIKSEDTQQESPIETVAEENLPLKDEL